MVLLGIVNTLALAVIERTRELGLLRAIGMDRSQTQAMIRWEGLVVSAIGTAIGLAVGAFLGWATATTAGAPGITLPTAQLALFAVAGLTAGLLAAALPARRAARTNILTAIATQ